MFLAIAVDKLSEVRSLEEDTMEETEKLLERRKEREEQISALKNPNEPQVQRRTIRRVMRYLADNPAERLKQLEAQRKKKRRQLPFQLDIKRGTSMINPPDSILSGHSSEQSYHRSTSDSAVAITPIAQKETEAVSISPSGVPVPGPGSGRQSIVSLSSTVSSAPKQRNPLRLMKRRSDYFDKQKMRLGGWPASSESQSARSSFASVASQASGSIDRRTSRGQATVSVDEDSVFDGDTETPSKFTERHLSVASTPESSKTIQDRHPLMVSYERTQSSPGDIATPIEVSPPCRPV